MTKTLQTILNQIDPESQKEDFLYPLLELFYDKNSKIFKEIFSLLQDKFENDEEGNETMNNYDNLGKYYGYNNTERDLVNDELDADYSLTSKASEYYFLKLNKIFPDYEKFSEMWYEIKKEISNAWLKEKEKQDEIQKFQLLKTVKNMSFPTTMEHPKTHGIQINTIYFLTNEIDKLNLNELKEFISRGQTIHPENVENEYSKNNCKFCNGKIIIGTMHESFCEGEI